MTLTTRARALTTAALCLAAAACDSPSHSDGPSGEAPRTRGPAGTPPQARVAPTLDDRFAMVADSVPSFGGVFLDAAGQPTMYLVDVAQAPRARAMLRRVFRDQPEFAGEITARRGRFAFGELRGYAARSAAVLSVPGSVSVDLDEAVNRVRIGVESESAKNQVAQRLTALGVAPEAVIVEVVAPFHPRQSLRDVVAPRPGGVEVEFRNGNGQGGVCTLGFSARSPALGPENTYFITNAHCTAVQGDIDAYSLTSWTFLYQPDDYGTGYLNEIGGEDRDPVFFTGGSCPAGRRCRYSDAAMYYPGYLSTDMEFGRIARPTYSGSLVGSLQIDPNNPRFNISGTASTLSGQTLQKVGRTTGWTFGNVTSTCGSINVAFTDITLLCQFQVDAGVQGGDSGSPVFSGTGSTSTLRGILWGGNNSNNRFAFSPISGIEQDFGFSLTVN